MKRLRTTFTVEAREHIQTLASGLVELERTATAEGRVRILDATFRSAHSLKGAARTVNMTEIEALCQSLETVFAALRREEILLSPELFDLLHHVVDALDGLLQFVNAEPAVSSKPRITGLIESLRAVSRQQMSRQPRALLEKSEEVSGAPPVDTTRASAEEKRGMEDTVRVATAKLDVVLLQAEELLAAKLAATQHATKLRQLQAQPSVWKKRWAKVRSDARTIQQALESKRNGNGDLPVSSHLLRVVEFLEWSQDFVASLEAELTDLARTADHDQRWVGGMVDNLLDEMKKVVMQPFSTLLDVFPRFVRELSRDQGKDVELALRGGDIEIDRRILEEMKDPLIHLVRNCLDHGIETPAERRQKGKPPRGTLTISIAPKNDGNVELLITDDGAGIDAGKVKAAAVKLGLLASEKAEVLGDHEAVSLIFHSGISTSPIITDLSGHGLGLAIVKEKVEKLNGALSIETKPGQGATFRIILPLTLARFRGVVVRVDEHLFVLPTTHVERVTRMRKADVKTVENRETVALNGEILPLTRLAEALALPRKSTTPEQLDAYLIVVLVFANQRIAFIVDEILQEQEVLVKPLGKQIVRARNIAGATILGSGKVAPILNTSDLIKAAVRISETSVRAAMPSAETIATLKKSVLVAEDSITARTLLKNILEAAGYQVETSVDGIDAFTKLRSGSFDLVVSDVEMPRLNGFGLTTKIRAEKKFAEIPVILVTALESREDREQGIDVGANAYIVKSSFDQSNLLEIIRRLI
ncbi:MAG: response regulator [Candidatus Binatia bacterium]